MEFLSFILKSSYDDFNRNKLRTFLTTLGIFIGILSVVLLIAAGVGLRKYIEDQFKSLGSNLVMIVPGSMFSGGTFRMTTSMMTGLIFDQKDALNLQRNEHVALAVPMYANYLEVQAEGKSAIYELLASTHEIFEMMNMEIDQGRLYTKTDVAKGSKVVVLGTGPVEKIFGTVENSVGKIVKIEKQSFRVIGVLKSVGGGGMGGLSMDDHVFIPYKAAYSFNPTKKFITLYAKIKDSSDIDEAKTSINKTFLKRYDQDDFAILNQQEVMDTFGSIFNIVNYVLVGIAAISLVVGGVGIMNIMYVSVVERINEIGIKRAFGARKTDILYIFLTESILLSLLGGALGLAVSYLIVFSISSIFPAVIDLNTVLLALGVSGFIGIVSGVLPATKAANLTPIEAIRHQ